MYVEASCPHLWEEANMIMMDDFFEVFLDLACNFLQLIYIFLFIEFFLNFGIRVKYVEFSDILQRLIVHSSLISSTTVLLTVSCTWQMFKDITVLTVGIVINSKDWFSGRGNQKPVFIAFTSSFL